MADIIPWIATVATIAGAFLTAANLGARVTGSGFVVFLAGSLCWLAAGVLSGQPALTWTNAVLTLLNLFGIWRWLGRQARVEEGGKAAAQASASTPGEKLFPVSLLTRAAVTAQSASIGSCVDALAGCRSGHIDYLVVSQGGIAGVGETLRRVPWSSAHVDGDKVVADLSPDGFERLDILERDQWPGR
jgi:hypothetical protein